MDNKRTTHLKDAPSHEMHPNAGVQVGKDKLENESMTKDYVFSNRFGPSEKQLKDANLPTRGVWKKGISWTKYIDNVQKNKTAQGAETDMSVQEQWDEELERAKATHEAQRIKREGPSTQEYSANPDPSTLPPQMQDGGFLSGFGDWMGNLDKEQVEGGIGALGTVANLGIQAFGPTGVDTSGATNYTGKKGAMGAGIAGGALQGASAGTMIMPGIGTAIGAGVGALAGGFGAGKQKRDEAKANWKFGIAQAMQNKMIGEEEAIAMYGGRKMQEGGDRQPPLLDRGLKNIANDLTDTFSFIGNSIGNINRGLENTSRNTARYILDKDKEYNVLGLERLGLDRFLKDSQEVNDPRWEQKADPRWKGYGGRKMQNGSYKSKYPSFLENFIGDQPIDNTPNIQSPATTRTPFVGTTPASRNIQGIEGITRGIAMQEDPDWIRGSFPSQITPKANFTDKQINQAERKVWWDENKGKVGDTANNALRFAPVATNLMQYLNMRKPENTRLSRIDKKFKPDYVDTQGLVNQVREQEGTTRRALKEASGGDAGALRSGLLMSHLNSIKGRSGAFMQAESINRQQNDMAQQFDQRNLLANMQQGNLEEDINARNRAAYDTNRSRFLSQMGQDIGNIGLENRRMKYPEQMGLGYGPMGEYFALVEAQKEAIKQAKAQEKAKKK